jgi:hypothetical protein
MQFVAGRCICMLFSLEQLKHSTKCTALSECHLSLSLSLSLSFFLCLSFSLPKLLATLLRMSKGWKGAGARGALVFFFSLPWFLCPSLSHTSSQK